MAKHKKTIIPVVTLLLIFFGGYLGLNKTESKEVITWLEQHAPGDYQTVRIEDGDTITVRQNGKEERVRLIGIDTPETQHPDKPVQCFGKAATQFTRELIGNSEVRLEADPNSDNRDIYGRLLRYVYLPDGTFVNAEVVKQGYGFAYVRFPHSKLDEFRGYEREARERRRGLWSSCEIKNDRYGQPGTVADE